METAKEMREITKNNIIQYIEGKIHDRAKKHVTYYEYCNTDAYHLNIIEDLFIENYFKKLGYEVKRNKDIGYQNRYCIIISW